MSRIPSVEPEDSRARLASYVWIFWVLFVLYGATAPFRFVGDRAFVTARLAHVQLSPLSRGSLDDLTANMLLFVPFGALGVLSLGARPTTRRIVLVVLLAAAFSIAIEGLQCFTVDRLSSIDDVIANVAGAVAGALAALVVAARLDALTDRFRATLTKAPALYSALLAGVLIALAAWHPFDFTGNVSGAGSVFVHKLHVLQGDRWQLNSQWDEALQLVRYALLTVLWSTTLSQLGVGASTAIAAVGAALVGVLLEATQFIVDGRMPGAAGAVANVTGAAIGAALVPVLTRQRSRWPSYALLAAATWMALLPHTLGPLALPLERPVHDWYRSGAIGVFSRSFEAALAYVPLGFAFPQTVRTRPRGVLAPLIVPFLVASSLAALSRWLGGSPGVVPIAVAVGASAIGEWAGSDGEGRFRAFVFGPSQR
jgi:VanZ family protein